MSKLATLRAKRGELVDAYAALADATDIDKKALDEKEAEIKKVDEQIEIADKAQKFQASVAKPSGFNENKILAFPQAKRTSRLKNFRGENAMERAYKFGSFMLASCFGNMKAREWCKENGIPLVVERAHSEGSASAGGYLVPDEFSAEIIDLRDEYGMFRRLCQPFPMGRDTMSIPKRLTGLTAYPVGEATAITESTASWGQVNLTARKWGVLTLVSSELDEDAIVNIGDLLVGEVAYAFATAEDNAGWNGDGTGTYHGITGFTKLFNDGVGTLAGAVDATSTHDTLAEVDATDLAKVFAKLPQYVYMRGRPAFYCSQAAWGLVFQRLIAGAGGISKDDVTGRVIHQYLGFPVEIHPSLPSSTGTINDTVMLLFGDIGLAAAFGDRRGMTVARSTEYKFAEDQIAIKGTERFDINIHSVGDNTTPGPVVALMGNT